MADYLENHNLKCKRTLKINQTFVFSIGRYEGIWCCWEKRIYIVHGYVVISSLWFPWSSKKYGNTFHRFTCVERQRRKTSLFVNFSLNLFSLLIFFSFYKIQSSRVGWTICNACHHIGRMKRDLSLRHFKTSSDFYNDNSSMIYKYNCIKQRQSLKVFNLGRTLISFNFSRG